MVTFCCAYGCNNKWSKESPLTFHRFPIGDKLKLQEWLLAVRRKNFTPSKYHRLCSDHFTEDCFAPRSPLHIRRILKKDAVPTVFNFKATTRKARPDGKGWKTHLKVLDEGIYPETGATTLCRCDLPDKLEDKDITRLKREYSQSGTDSFADVSARKSKCGKKTVRKSIVSTRSLTSVVEQLNSARQEINHLVHSIKMYEQEHVELHMERGNPLVRSVHLIRRNAVDGDYNALMLINQIAGYTSQE